MKLSPVHLTLGLVILASLLAPIPNGRAQSPQAAPNLTPKRPHSAASSSSGSDASANSDQPVAIVNGIAVYRPLMRSAVADPVDRALLIFAYHKNGVGMNAHDKEIIVEQFKMNQFQDSDKKLDAKLHALNATRDDYKQYAVEETKIRDMLRTVTRGARSTHQAQQMQASYLGELRKSASINTARS